MSKEVKNTIALIGGIFLAVGIAFCTINQAEAGGYNHNTTNNYYESETILSGIDGDDLAEATATAAACSGNFYFGSTRPQGRVDWASYDGKQKLCFQGAIRPGDDTNVQVDFGVVPDNNPDKALYRAGILVIF